MPYLTPEHMPQDWLVPALESIGVSIDDPRADEIERTMRETYQRVLEESGVMTLNGRLRAACLAAVQGRKDD